MKYFKKFDLYKLLLEATDDQNQELENNEEGGNNTKLAKEKQEKKEEVKEDEVPNPNEQGSVEQLNKQLSKWNLEYSQAFKFLNDRPKSSEITSNKVDGQFNKLIETIADKYKDKVKKGIKDIVSILNNPKYNTDKKIEVAGHTSSTGSNAYNQALSERRSNIVKNAILDYAKNIAKLDEDSVKRISDKLILKGYGENDPIIMNDNPKKNEDGTFPEVSFAQGVKGSEKMSDETQEELQTNPEARQRLNRRVEINLQGMKNKVIPPDKVITAKTKPEKKDNKFDPSSILFHDDSYLLLDSSKAILDNLAKQLSSDENKVKDIYISAHAEKGKGKNREDYIYPLTLNRA
jgi:outer membrane protein OmpA-like peptidoglycan-associated protein